MRRAPALLVLAALALLAAPAAARAQAPRGGQDPASFLARGLGAYRNLDYDSAAVLLRRALSSTASPALADTDRVRAFVYLGATELYRERRDTAAALFGRVLRLDPRYRIDQLVFPPEVTGLFQQVRLVTRAVAIVVPGTVEMTVPGEHVGVSLYASTFHQVVAAVTDAKGATVRTLYSGGLGDSLEVEWDGLAADGTAPDSGSYLLRVDSRGADGKVVRSIGVPLDIRRVRRDTLPLPAPPADSLLKNEYRPGTNGLRELGVGVAGALTVTLLPSLVTSSPHKSGDRFLVAGGLSAAGLLGFFSQRRPQPIAENIAANRVLQAAWQHQADSLHAENVARTQEVRLRMDAGPARVLGPGAP